MPLRQRVRWFWVFVATLVVLSAVVPITYYWAGPNLYRWMMVRGLLSDDLDTREEALNWLILHGDDDPKLLDGAIAQLDVAQDDNFLQIVQALDTGGLWMRPPIPDGPWLRWIGSMLDAAEPPSRQVAAKLLASMPELADDRRVIEMVQTLCGDADEAVRYHALIAAAELYGAADDNRTYESIIVGRVDDDAPRVARQAWLLLGLIDPISGVSTQWRDKPPAVAQAILWAAMMTNRDYPAPAIEAMTDESADPAVRTMAAYVLHLSGKPAARDALVRVIEQAAGAEALDEAAGLIAWRAVLGVPIDGDDPADPARAALMKLRERPLNDALRLSAIYRLPELADAIELTRPAILDSPDVPADAAALDEHPDVIAWNQANLAKLAAFEGIAAQRAFETPRHNAPLANIEITYAMQEAVWLAAVAATADPQPRQLRMFFAAGDSTTRDLACIIAADRFDKQQNQQLAVDLLRSFNDNEKMSGAILAGLTGVDTVADVDPQLAGEPRKDLLMYWARHASAWPVRTVMQVGLWMRGAGANQGGSTGEIAGEVPGEIPGDIPGVPGDQADAYIASLLVRDDLPWTTVLLALLHKDHPAAMRFLFESAEALSTEPLDLSFDPQELFDKHRWWRVFRRYRPDERLTFWLWGDPQLEDFQVEVMRSWWLLNRHR